MAASILRTSHGSCHHTYGISESTAAAETTKAGLQKIMLHMKEQAGIQSDLSFSSTPFGDHVGE